jgi:hypothetical protein
VHVRRAGAERVDIRWEDMPVFLTDKAALRAALIREGGYAAVAAELGWPVQHVRWAARQHGITMTEIRQARNAAIVALHAAGHLQRSIAAALGVNPGTVSRALDAAGLPDRRGGRRGA